MHQSHHNQHKYEIQPDGNLLNDLLQLLFTCIQNGYIFNNIYAQIDLFLVYKHYIMLLHLVFYHIQLLYIIIRHIIGFIFIKYAYKYAYKSYILLNQNSYGFALLFPYGLHIHQWYQFQRIFQLKLNVNLLNNILQLFLIYIVPLESAQLPAKDNKKESTEISLLKTTTKPLNPKTSKLTTNSFRSPPPNTVAHTTSRSTKKEDEGVFFEAVCKSISYGTSEDELLDELLDFIAENIFKRIRDCVKDGIVIFESITKFELNNKKQIAELTKIIETMKKDLEFNGNTFSLKRIYYVNKVQNNGPISNSGSQLGKGDEIKEYIAENVQNKSVVLRREKELPENRYDLLYSENSKLNDEYRTLLEKYELEKDAFKKAIEKQQIQLVLKEGGSDINIASDNEEELIKLREELMLNVNSFCVIMAKLMQ